MYRHSVLSVSLALAMGVSSVSALADEGVLEEVLVEEVKRNEERVAISATRTPTALIDTPQSISVVTEAQIEEQQFRSLGELFLYVPGISVSQGEAHRDAINIRGNQTTADFFIDGLRDDVQYFRPLYNVERVEILRGANALLFGRGGTGGIINRVMKKAEHGKTFSEVSGIADTFGGFNVLFDGNTDVNDRVAVRLNGFYERMDNHRDFFEGERFGFNPTIDITLGADTRLSASYEFLNDDRVVDRGVPSVGNAIGRGPLEGFDNTFFGSPEQNNANLVAHIFRTRLDHRFNEQWKADLNVQYAYYDKMYQNLYPIGFDPAANTVTLDGYRDPTDRENIFTQGNLIGEFDTAGLRHTLLVGAEWGDQDTNNSRLDTRFSPPGGGPRVATIAVPFTDPLALPGFAYDTPERNREVQVNTLSFYLQDQVEIVDWLQLVGGFRVDRFDIDATDLLNVESLSQTNTEVSKRFGIIVKPVRDLSLYTSYSETFQPPSGDQALEIDLRRNTLDPQSAENIEAGVKWDILPSLALTAAVFRLELGAVTEVDPNDPARVITLGGTIVRGAEAQLLGAITDQWTVSAGLSYLDGEIEDPGNATDGNTTRETPEYMASLWSRYNLTDRLGFGVGVTHQSEYFAAADNAVVVPGYTRLDGAIFYRVNPRVDLQVNVENITNTDYFPNSHSNDNITTGEPINATFAVRARF